MNKHILNLCLCCMPLLGIAQTHFKFDFGEGDVQKGFLPVGSTSFYTKEKGYGFMPGATIKAVTHKAKNALTSDYLSSQQPFFFTVDIPEGNYRVKVWLGDSEAESRTTIKAECRRLMVQKAQTRAGEIKEVSFLVHIRTPQIQGDEKVKLKPREIEYLHWDNQLTLEFSDKLPKICGLEISPAPHTTTVYLAGNSTVVDQAIEPFAAWGQMIPAFFDDKKIVIANYAESGETLKSFTTEKRLAKIMSQIKAGDYFFIEFAHNDQKKGSGVDDLETYKSYLKDFIRQAKEKGATPVLVTSMHRRSFDEQGKIINTLVGFPDAMRQVAQEEKVKLIDLNSMSKTLYEALGLEPSKKAFVHYPANSFPNQPNPIADNTHFSPYGAYLLASCIVEGMKKADLPLVKYLKKGLKPFDPAQPDKAEDWDLPLSPLVSVIKPDGN